MKIKNVPAKYIIGIAIRTTNQNNQSALDIPKLWQDFHTLQIRDKIPAKASEDLYVIYTNYDSDFTAPYTTIIGCEVQNTDKIPSGMVAHIIPEGCYTQLVIEGDLEENSVLNAWIKIWNSPTIERTYTSDFEVYRHEAQDSAQAKVAIYLATK